jgi:hypothetical protein
MANEFKIKKGLIVEGASSGTVVDIQGSQGQLFSVTDDLSGSIFAVSDISGVPILDVNSSGLSTFSDNVVIGSVDTVVTGLNIGEASPTIQLFDTTNDGKLLMYMQDSSAVIGTYSNHSLNLFSNSTLALSIDISQNATFSGDARFNQRVRVGDVSGLSNRGTVRIDTRGDVPADLLFGRDTAGTATGWTNVFWSISSRGSSEGNTFKIYRGNAHSSPYDSEAVPFTISPDLSATFAGTVTAPTFVGDLNGTINTATTGVTQTAGNNSTLIATTAYADAAAAAVPIGNYLPLSAGSGSPLTGDLYIEGADKALRINNGAQPVVYLGDGGANTDGQLILYNSSGSANIVLNGDNQNHYITNGNVGIGTTNPDADFVVSHQGTSGIEIEANFQMGVNNILSFDRTVGALAYETMRLSANDYWFTTLGIERMRIASDGNVGIGTTSPNTTLDIRKALGTGLISSTNSTLRLVDTSTGLNARQGAAISLSGVYNSSGAILGGSPYIRAAKANANDGDYGFGLEFGVRLNGSATPTTEMVIDQSGNVGIGTTSPSAKLHVTDGSARIDGGSYNLTVDHGAGSGSAGVVLQSTGSNLPFVRWTDGTNINAGIRGTSANALKFQTNGFNDRMTIDGSGNVGIGTTSPSAQLTVAKSATIGAASTHNTTTNIENVLKVKGKNNYSDGTTWFGDYGQILLSASNNMTASARQFLITNALDNNKFAIIRSTDWSTPPSTNSTATGVNSGTADFVITNVGNVGIGTTSPSNKLEVVGSNAVRIHDGTDQGSIFFRGDRDDVYIKESNYQLLFGAPSGMLFELDTNNNNGDVFNVMHRGSSRMYINGATGNVGINNTSPVNGKLVVTSTEEDLLNTVRIQHTRSNSNFGSKALEIDMNLSGADTTTADRTNRGIYVDLDSSADGDAANEHRIHGIESDVRFTGFSDIVRAGQFFAESNNITEKTAQLVGVYGQAVHDAGNAAGGVSNMIGAYGYSSIQDLGDVDNAFGVYGLVDIGDNRGNADVGVTKAVEGEISINKSTALNYGTMIGISSIIDNNEGSVPNFGDQYLFKGDYQGTRGNNAWGIYTEGDKNYFEGNVGIGTTSPSSKLNVVAGTGSPTVLLGRATGQASIKADTDSSGHLIIDSSTGHVYINNYVNKNIYLANGGGNVGIGTTSPASKLHIDSGATDEVLRLEGTGSPYLSFYDTGVRQSYIGSFGNTLQIHADTPDTNIAFYTEGTHRAIIDSSGNLGIGTTSPSAKLEVNGQTVINSTGLTEGFQWFNDTNEIFSLEDTSGAGELLLLSSNSVKVKLNANGTSYFNGGNIGIGTTSPGAKLHVNSENSQGTLIISRGGNNLAATNNVGSITFPADYNGTPINYAEIKAYANALSGVRGSLDFNVKSTSGTVLTGMTVYGTSSGVNVGIGTTSPSTKLMLEHNNDGAVGGTIRIRDRDSQQAANQLTGAIEFESEDATTPTSGVSTAIKAFAASSTGGSYLTISTTDVSTSTLDERMRIDSSGNVGIGTTSPNAKLDVQGTQGQLFSVTDDLSGDIFSVADISGVPILNVNSDGTSYFDGRLRIQGSASMATSPMFELHRTSPVIDYKDLNSSGYVYSRERFLNSGGTVIASREVAQNPGLSGIYHNFDSGASGGSQFHQKQNSFHWKINSTSEKLTLHSNGYIGINDTSPSYQLDVNGSGRFTSTVTATNFILSSDERLKENVKKVCDNRVKADWKTFELKTDKGQKRYGVIAQELEKTNPEFVREDSQGFKSVAYIDLLIAKIAELEARLEKLEK